MNTPEAMTKHRTPNNEHLKSVPDLSIIIVCYKGWPRLHKCLKSIDKFAGNNFTTEVIIVDNKSDDEAIHDIEKQYPKFKFISNTMNGGFANGSNLGSRNASGDFLLFLNPDTVVSEPEIEKLLNAAKKTPDYIISSCRQVNENGKESVASGDFPSMFNLTGFQRAVFRSRVRHTVKQPADIISPDWISGSVLMIKREVFLQIHGFDEDFWMYFEDVDLCRRISDINGKIALYSSIVIEHNHGGSSRINIKTTTLTKTEVFISRHLYISKHKTGMERFIIQMFLIVNNLISAGIMALVGLFLFFIPKLYSRTLIFLRLLAYYAGALLRQSWISPRSPNFIKR